MPKSVNEKGVHIRTGEVIGGGWFVFRRGGYANRIKPSEKPYEHPTEESAVAEHKRLSEKYPTHKYSIFREVQVG